MPPTPIASPDPQIVTRDFPCNQCNYNLRSLRIDGLCPECATPIALSLKTHLLADANPRWINLLKFGALAILADYALTLIVEILQVVLPLVSYLGNWTSYAFFFTSLLSYLGIWLITTRERQPHNQVHNERIRVIIRYCVAFSFAQTTLFFIDRNLRPYFDLAWTIARLLVWVGYAKSIVAVITLVLELTYLRTLALRIPDDRLHKTFGLLRYTYGSLLAMSTLYGFFMQWFWNFRPRTPTGLPTGLITLIAINYVIILPMLIFVVIYLLAMTKFFLRLKTIQSERRHPDFIPANASQP